MGVKHELILGVILIWSLCISQDTATELSNATVDNVIEEVTHRNVNLIEKLPKTDTEQKDVYSNTHDPSIILSKGNITNHESTTLTVVNLTSTTPSSTKENAVKKLGIEKNREDSARSIDIEKYVSPEFQNNVFTLPNFPETEKYFDIKSSTEKTSPYSDFDLTTPKTDYFDNKFKEVSEELRQKVGQVFDETQNENDHDHDDGTEHEHEDLQDNEEEDNDDDDDELQVDKILEEPKINPNTTLDYKELKNIIVKNNTDGKKSARNDVTVEKVKRVNFVSNFNDTKIYDYDSKDDVVTTTSKTETSTTQKPIELTKPPNHENNSDILNNKIETGTIKAILSTTEFTATKRSIDVENISREPHLVHQNTSTEASNIAIIETTSNITITTESMETTTSELDTTTAKLDSTIYEEIAVSEQYITTVEPKSEVLLNDSSTTETTDIPTSTVNAGIHSSNDETTVVKEQTTEEYTTEQFTSEPTTYFQTTADSIETTTLLTTENVPSIEQSSKYPDSITTGETDMFITTKRAQHGFVPKITSTQDSYKGPHTIAVTASTVRSTPSPTTSTSTTTSTTTTVPTTTTATEKPETTLKYNPSSSRPDTTVSPPSSEPTNKHPTPTTDEISLRHGISTEESSEPPYGTETSVGTHLPAEDDGNNNAVVIAISTVGAVCLVLLAGLLYIMRKRQKRFNYKQRCRPVGLDDYSVDNVSAYNSVRRKGGDRQSKRSYGNPAFDDPSAPTHPLNFPALAKFGTEIEDIKSEFNDIPQITAKTSELPEGCEPKNRYANVIPLPETRVSLKITEGYPNSDYINANYVTGHKKIKGFYIACQAPMQNTVDDFWRMIWEQQSKVILMVTHFFENGVEKCVDYLPPSEVLDCHRLFGDFQVTLKKRDVKEKYIISSLQLKNMVSNSWREVTHFWYLGWPEKGIPSEANSLIAFLIEARSYMKTSTLDRNAVANGTNSLPRTEVNPVVVHCSPGTGRTGVVMACDIAIREFEQTRLVDIPKIVYMIRRDRANAVQTKEQYTFIYKVVSLYATKLTGGSLESF